MSQSQYLGRTCFQSTACALLFCLTGTWSTGRHQSGFCNSLLGLQQFNDVEFAGTGVGRLIPCFRISSSCLFECLSALIFLFTCTIKETKIS